MTTLYDVSKEFNCNQSEVYVIKTSAGKLKEN